jgi:hypothetical protein
MIEEVVGGSARSITNMNEQAGQVLNVSSIGKCVALADGEQDSCICRVRQL